MRPAILFIALVAACVQANAAAPIDPDLQVGPGWRFFHVESASEAGIKLRVTGDGPAALWMILFVGDEYAGYGATIVDGAEGGLVVDTDLTTFDATPVVSTPLTFNTGYGTFTGPHNVLVIAAGAINEIEYSLIGTGTHELLDAGVVHAYDGRELSGGAWAKARAVRASSDLAVARSLEFDVEHTLIGSFFNVVNIDVLLGDTTLRSETTTDVCMSAALYYSADQFAPGQWSECFPRFFEGPDARGPGHYRVDWTGVRAGASNTIVMAWADVPWPENAT